jgi:carboxyl-terminal processing protease
MKRKVLYSALVVGLTINLIIGARIYFYSVQAAPKDDAYANLRLFTSVLERVHQDYVDGEKVSYQQLISGALKGMLNSLDPHSEFMDASKYEELKKDTEGTFGGVGIVVQVKDNYLTVVSPIEDTPGARAGILPMDRIIKIDGRSTDKVMLQDAVKKLRGKPGTDVTVTVLRPSNNQVYEHKLTRAEIKVDTVKDINGKREFPVDDHKIGYIRLVQFGEHTSTELESALHKLETQGMQSLILDLRNNPGGLLDQAGRVCEKFLPGGKLIVSTEGRNSTQKSEFRSHSGTAHRKMPMVLLVNIGSASASEIVAGCLQDLQRVVVIGEQTFGKGSVQTVLPLPDGQGLRLTTAKYYTPSHRVIHEKGITPDIIVSMTEEEERDMLMKRSPGGVEGLEPKERERIMNAHDPQYERALDLLKGLSLFGQLQGKPEKIALQK